MSSSTPASSATGRPVDPLTQRGAGDRDRIDQVGLAALSPAAPLTGHQPRRDADDALATDEQDALERAGDVSTVLKCPHALRA